MWHPSELSEVSPIFAFYWSSCLTSPIYSHKNPWPSFHNNHAAGCTLKFSHKTYKWIHFICHCFSSPDLSLFPQSGSCPDGQISYHTNRSIRKCHIYLHQSPCSGHQSSDQKQATCYRKHSFFSAWRHLSSWVDLGHPPCFSLVFNRKTSSTSVSLLTQKHAIEKLAMSLLGICYTPAQHRTSETWRKLWMD